MDKKTYWIIGIILLIGIIFFLPKLNLFSTVLGGVEYTTTSVSEDNAQYVILSHAWVGQQTAVYPRDEATGICTVGGDVPFQPFSQSSLKNMPAGLTNSYDKSFNVIKAVVGGVEANNLGGSCILLNNGGKVGLDCTFSGKASCPQLPSRPWEGSFSSGGYLQVKIYKDGYCSLIADVNCDNKVDRTELGAFITKWINNQVTREELGQAIQSWVIG